MKVLAFTNDNDIYVPIIVKVLSVLPTYNKKFRNNLLRVLKITTV